MNWRLSYSNEESVKRRSRSKREAGGGGTSWRVGDFWSGSGMQGKLTACRPEGIFSRSIICKTWKILQFSAQKHSVQRNHRGWSRKKKPWVADTLPALVGNNWRFKIQRAGKGKRVTGRTNCPSLYPPSLLYIFSYYLSGQTQMPKFLSTLFRSARTSCTSSGGPINPSVRPYARKIWITYIKAYMPYESSKTC